MLWAGISVTPDIAARTSAMTLDMLGMRNCFALTVNSHFTIAIFASLCPSFR